jgi:tRNA A37 threonylcarbamoyladenosine synthetase subunit TsaC/SUA5/YrdC
MHAFPEPLTFIIPKPSEPQKTFLHPHTGNSLAYRVEFLTMLIKAFANRIKIKSDEWQRD